LLREEIDTKNDTIKEISKYVEELQRTQSENIENTVAFHDMFKRLDEYNKISETIN
jgi:Asp-tRNA(Asn)/Glu-tRNA(Gln) amidotransferase C subunit